MPDRPVVIVNDNGGACRFLSGKNFEESSGHFLDDDRRPPAVSPRIVAWPEECGGAASADEPSEGDRTPRCPMSSAAAAARSRQRLSRKTGMRCELPGGKRVWQPLRAGPSPCGAFRPEGSADFLAADRSDPSQNAASAEPQVPRAGLPVIGGRRSRPPRDRTGILRRGSRDARAPPLPFVVGPGVDRDTSPRPIPG